MPRPQCYAYNDAEMLTKVSSSTSDKLKVLTSVINLMEDDKLSTDSLLVEKYLTLEHLTLSAQSFIDLHQRFYVLHFVDAELYCKVCIPLMKGFVCILAFCYVLNNTVVREIFVRDNLVVKFIRCVKFSWASYTHENILPSNFICIE